MKMSKKVKNYYVSRACAVFGCNSYRKGPIPKVKDENFISFHKFPRAPEIRKSWIWACKRADEFNPETTAVCSKHFSKSDYERDLKSELMDDYKPRRMLKPGAVPHLQLFERNPESESAKKRRERYALKAEKEDREKFIRSIFEESTPPLQLDSVDKSVKPNPLPKIPSVQAIPILPSNSTQPYRTFQPNLSANFPSVVTIPILPSNSQPNQPNRAVQPNLFARISSVQSRLVLPSNSTLLGQPDVYEQLRRLQSKVSVLEKRLEEEKKMRLAMCSKASSVAQNKVSQLNVKDLNETDDEIVSSDSDEDSDSSEDSAEIKPIVVLDSENELSCNEEKPSFVCSTCNSFFDSWELLNNHVMNEHFEVDLEESDQVEEFLIESIETEDKANNVESDSENKVGECKVCKTVFTLKALRKHEQTHNKERPYICSFCDKTFAQLAYVKKHERLHTGEKPFECDTCHKTFAQKYNLKLHERVHSRKLKCRFCNQRFPFRRGLLYHERTHKNGPFDCLYCESKFSDLNELRFHELAHNNQKPFRCSVCQMEFLSKHSLQIHSMEHSGKNPFKCDLCDRVLCSKSSLMVHKRTHTGEKPYKCKVCHFATTYISTIKNHMRTHSGERPYKCQFCKRTFAHGTSRKIHEQTHTGDKSYKCKSCPKQFSTSTKLKVHSQYRHPNELEEQNSPA